MERPMKLYGCMAIAGPLDEVMGIHAAAVGLYNDVDLITTPDDMGQFPDTSGYTSKNWASMESTMEDPALFPYMTKAMDAVMSRVDKRFERFCEQYPGKVEKVINWPKFGGKVFAVAGFVKVYPHAITLVH